MVVDNMTSNPRRVCKSNLQLLINPEDGKECGDQGNYNKKLRLVRWLGGNNESFSYKFTGFSFSMTTSSCIGIFSRTTCWAMEISQPWWLQLLPEEGRPHCATTRSRGSRQGSDSRYLTSLLILFSSYGNLVLLQIHLPNNSRNQRSVSKPAAQNSSFWAQEHASQRRQGLQSDESQ